MLTFTTMMRKRLHTLTLSRRARFVLATASIGWSILAQPALAGRPAASSTPATASASTPAPAGSTASAPTVLPVPIASVFNLTGPTLQGPTFSLDRLRGRVVLVYYWATDCSICLDKMPELRANVEGWRTRPFSVVYVQMDKQLQAAQAYWKTVDTTQRAAMPTVIWRNDPSYHDSLTQRPTNLPFSVLVDTQGRVITSVEGRIPPEVWNQVAEQLP